MNSNRFKFKALTWSLILGGTLSAASHAQIVLSDGDFPYNDRVFINSGTGTFGVGDVHIQNAGLVEINYAGPGGNGLHALAVENNARLDVDNAISLKTGGSAGHALLVVGGGKAYFGGDLKAETTNINNSYYTVGVTGSNSVLEVNGNTEIIAIMGANGGAGFYNGSGSRSTFNGDVTIRAGSEGVFSLGTTVFNGQTYIEVQKNGAGGLIANPDATGSVTFNDVVTIKSTPVSDSSSYNYGMYVSGNRVYLNQGGTIDMSHGFANSSAVGIYAANSGIVEVKNGTFEIDTTENNGTAYALFAASGANINIHDTVANIKGHFYATGANSIISVKTNPGSVLDGDAMMASGGTVNFDLNQTDWQLRSSSVINELKGSNSHIRFAQPGGGTPVFNTLTINQLSGNGHVFYLNTELNDGLTQLTDKLVINDTASGNHKLHINDVGGVGTLTVQGIKVVDIQSTVTSNTANFALNNTVVSNAYEYLLHQDAMDGSWYLSSQAYTPGPGTTPTFRPDVGINTANSNALIDLSVPGFGYSGGKKWMEFQRTPENSSDFWVHANGSKIKGDAVSQVKYDADLWGVSFGGDKRFETSKGVVHIGAMANIAGADSKARNRISGSEATGSVEGYAVGVYGTWYLSGEEDVPVPYIDGLLSYGIYDNDVSTKGNPSRSYDANVVTASLQAGYPIQITDSVAIEPQAQITYINVSTDDYTDHTGTKVSTDVNGNLISRIGAYVYRTEGKVRPYAGLSVWHDPTYTKVYYTDNSGRTGLSSHKRGAIADARIGVRAQLNRNWDMWAEGGYRRGGHGYQNVGAMVGLNYSF